MRDSRECSLCKRFRVPQSSVVKIKGVLEAIRLSYFAWIPSLLSIGIGVGFLVTHQPIFFVLSTLVGMVAGLAWAVWFNVDR